MINEYEVGDRVKISTSSPFADGDDVAFDPDVVTFWVRPPGGSVVPYIYNTDSEVTRVGIGDYECEIDVNKAGTWHYHITGTEGDNNAGAAQGYFKVKKRQA